MRTTNAVFSTLTVSRTKNQRESWLSISSLSNRYVQRIRRKVDLLEYLQAFEQHQDGYPHVHLLLLFNNYHYAKTNSRWLPTELFTRLKSSWLHGLSDHQQPITNSNYGALSYILKYVTKSSSNGLWKNLLPLNTDVPSPETNELNSLYYAV